MKNSGYAMPYMPGTRGTGILTIYPADDGGGAELQGETYGAGQIPRVWEISDKGVTGYALTNL